MHPVKHDARHVVHSNTIISSTRANKSNTASQNVATMIVNTIEEMTKTIKVTTGITVKAQNNSTAVVLRGCD